MVPCRKTRVHTNKAVEKPNHKRLNQARRGNSITCDLFIYGQNFGALRTGLGICNRRNINWVILCVKANDNRLNYNTHTEDKYLLSYPQSCSIYKNGKNHCSSYRSMAWDFFVSFVMVTKSYLCDKFLIFFHVYKENK